MTGHICVLVPMGKCAPDVLNAVLQKVVPAVDQRRELVVINAYSRDVLNDVRPATRTELDVFTSLAPPESDLVALLRWAAKLVETAKSLRVEGKHVLIVGPYYIPGYTELYDRVTNDCADGIIAIGTGSHYNLIARHTEMFPRAVVLSYGDEEDSPWPWPDELDRFSMSRPVTLDGAVFQLVAAPLGIPEIS